MKLVLAALAATLIYASTAQAAGRCGEHPWCDTHLSPDARAAMLVAAMTLPEKLSLMAGDDATGVLGLRAAGHTGTSIGIRRLGVPDVFYTDGPVGVRQGTATKLPTPLSVAASFDAAIARRAGIVIGSEARAKGNDVVHAPTVDVMRTPLAGRTFEGFGEDPWLSSRMAVGWIEGAQGQGVIANVKHFVANSQEGPNGIPPLGALDGGRTFVDARIDERTLREIYLRPFEAAVREAHVGTVMCAYNSVNGHFACENHHLLEDILRGDWGFRGYVLSDYLAAVKSTAPSVNGGLDLEMPVPILYTPLLLQAAIATGQVSVARIDQHIRTIMRTMFAYGLFDRAGYRVDDSQIHKQQHFDEAARIEEAGITLLRNDGVLPLDAARQHSLAVIGDAATRVAGGGGSSEVKPFFAENALNAIKKRAGPAVTVSYDPGASASRAAQSARGADVALVFVADASSEGTDRACLSVTCDGKADALIEAVRAANPNTVVVLETGDPVLTPWRHRVRGVLEAWYPGEAGGRSIARVLFGDVDPGGRLPVSFPAAARDTPTFGDREAYPGVLEIEPYKEGVLVGYRHYDAKGFAPAFAFGAGLSYARFSYGRPQVRQFRRGGTVTTLGFTARNVGRRRGTTVAQLYVHKPRPRSGLVEPPRELVAFAKGSIRAGGSRRFAMALTARSLAHWDTASNGWLVAPGCYELQLGRSSRAIVRRSVLAVGVRCRGAAARIPVPDVRDR